MDLSIRIAPDRMSAEIDLPSGLAISVERLKELLSAQHIDHGLARESLMEAVRSADHDRSLVVSHGQAPEHGTDATFAVLIDEGRHVSVDTFDCVDFHELGLLREVKAGTPLARITPPTPGQSGFTVTGDVLPAKPGKDLDPAQYSGEGTCLSDDGRVILSAIAGIYRRTRQNKIQVQGLLTVDGDVDFRSGNIVTDLPVLIKGDIKSGFSVKSAADIQVMGAIEDARVSAQGNLTVRSGILPGSARVKAHGNIRTRYITGREVKAHDIDVAESIRNARIQATGSVTAKAIMGGSLIVAGSVVCDVLGTEDGRRASVQVGINPFEETLYQVAKREHDTFSSDVVHLKERCKLIARTIQQAGPGSEAAVLGPQLRTAIADFTAMCNRLAHCEAILKRHDQRAERIETLSSSASVQVKRLVHAGVELIFGDNKRLELTGDLKGGRFILSDGQIVTQ